MAAFSNSSTCSRLYLEMLMLYPAKRAIPPIKSSMFKANGNPSSPAAKSMTAAMTSKARRIVTDLFDIFLSGPQLLPPDYQVMDGDLTAQARRVADYIAGMTDRYAMREYRRLFAVDEI